MQLRINDKQQAYARVCVCVYVYMAYGMCVISNISAVSTKSIDYQCGRQRGQIAYSSGEQGARKIRKKKTNQKSQAYVHIKLTKQLTNDAN